MQRSGSLLIPKVIINQKFFLTLFSDFGNLTNVIFCYNAGLR